MSTHQIQSSTSDPSDSLRWERINEIQRLVARFMPGRAFSDADVSDDGATLSVTFTPDLTTQELARWRRIVAISGMLRITPDEWASIEGDIDNARAYVNLASPTLVQTAGMLKGVIRILRVIVRD